MFCKNCGNEIKENEKFCTKCGTKISNDTEHINNVIQDKSKSNNSSKKKNVKSIMLIVIFIIIIGIVINIILNNKGVNIENNIKNEELSQQQYNTISPTGNEKDIEFPVATIKVKDYGTMKIELYYNEAPNTVKNFIALANNGFYDNLTFHRIVKDFIVQGGDKNGDGTGHATLRAINKETTQDKEYSIEGEFKSNGIDNNIQFEKGVIAMARSDYSSYSSSLVTEGYNSASSQFFIMTKDEFSLNGEYAAFGKVIEGIDILDKLNNVEVSAESDKPINPPIIESIRVNTKNKQYDLPETMDVFFETGDNSWLSDEEYLEIAYKELINRKLILKNSYGYKQTFSKEIIDIEKHEENNFLILNMKVIDTLYSEKGSVGLEMRFIVAIYKDGTISEIRQTQ